MSGIELFIVSYFYLLEALFFVLLGAGWWYIGTKLFKAVLGNKYTRKQYQNNRGLFLWAYLTYLVFWPVFLIGVVFSYALDFIAEDTFKE